MKVFKIGPAVLAFASAVALTGCGGGGAPQHPATSQTHAAQSSAQNSTQTFPDGTKVTFVSATWVMMPDDEGPGVKFAFHIVAGPDWKQNAKVELRPGSGSERPYNYYMVSAAGWFYPDYNSTGYADLSDIHLADGGVESGQGANTLYAGDSIYAYSTLATKSAPSNPQHLVVTIEMPNGQLKSRSFVANVGPDTATSQAVGAPSASS